jgi:hypothetical protein
MKSVYWHATRVHAFAAVVDRESDHELLAVLTEKQAHRDALQQGLNRMFEQHARGPVVIKAICDDLTEAYRGVVRGTRIDALPSTS